MEIRKKYKIINIIFWVITILFILALTQIFDTYFGQWYRNTMAIIMAILLIPIIILYLIRKSLIKQIKEINVVKAALEEKEKSSK